MHSFGYIALYLQTFFDWSALPYWRSLIWPILFSILTSIVFVMLWRLLIAAWERADLLVLVCDVKCDFVTFPLVYPRTGVALDCIDSWSLPSFLLLLCLSCFHVCSLLPCGHLKGKGWPLGSCLWCLMWFCYFPIWYPGTGVVLDCIDSWSLLSFFLPNDTERVFTPLCGDGSIVADSQHSRTHLSHFARCTLGLSRHLPAIFLLKYIMRSLLAWLGALHPENID